MTELLETRFFALLAGESFEEITKEDLEDELGKFVEEVAGLCDLGTYSGAYPFTFRQPIKHKIAFKSTILYPFIP